MFKTLRLSFQMDFASTINSFIYTLKRTPVVNKIIMGNLYKSKKAKKIISVLAGICTCIRIFGTKFVYLGVVYGILLLLFSKVDANLLSHTFIFLSFIGMLINDQILAVGKKKYYSVLLLGMDAKKYTFAYYFFQMICTFFSNLVALLVVGCGSVQMPLYMPFVLSLLVVFLKTIGEAINLSFYKRTYTRLISRTSLYFFILLMGVGLAFLLPKLGIVLLPAQIFIMFFTCFVLSVFAFIYLVSVKDYKQIYKKIHTRQAVMNQEYAQDYQKQASLEVRKRDYKINEKKLVGKSGADYFNTIFFLRHRAILSNSANIFTACAFFLVCVTFFLVIGRPLAQKELLQMITDHFAWILIVMYFVNRGAIITQAMFYNCDRSMLSFAFYRDPKVILDVFKGRLKTIVRVNLRPALVIGIGLVGILSLCSHGFDISYLFVFLSVIFLSIFFSVHYLVIYYLLQPYNSHMQMKSFSFSVASFLTYFICYLCKDIQLSLFLFSLIILILTVLYIIISLIVVYKKAPDTFRLKS